MRLQWNSDSYSSLNMDWNELFLDLIKFKQQWGHFDFPQKYAKNPKIEVWVSQHSTQYRLLKDGKKSSISDEKISKLGKLGFQWNYSQQFALDMPCNMHLSALMKFKQY